jgi:large subunit ribosomal protein L10
MERAEKVEFLAKLNDRFGRAPIAVLTDYRGLKVAELTDLRTALRKVDGEYLVAKNTLTRLAVGETTTAKLADVLKGPTAIAFGFSDAVAIAKTVQAFAKDHAKLVVKAAVLEGEVLTAAAVERLATMPGRDQLRAQFLALLMTPATQLVRVLSAPSRAAVQVLDARRRQLEEGA